MQPSVYIRRLIWVCFYMISVQRILTTLTLTLATVKRSSTVLAFSMSSCNSG